MSLSLGSFGENPSSPKGILADWQHASKIFLAAGHRLSPRVKFLYYLFVEIDSAAHGASAFTAATQNGAEVSLLVKRAELPKFSFETVTKNQYNRKKVVYKQLNYDPITLTFHDDNAGVMNSLYALYYSYHSKDHNNSPNDYRLGNGLSTKRYNMDIDIQVNLFKRVSLFTLGNGLYSEYKLLGPRIKGWTHGDVDYSSNADTIESSMTLEYEGVVFSSGSTATGVMDGFATLGYDTVASPNSPARDIGVGSGNLNTALGSLSQKNLLQRPGNYAPVVAATNQNYLSSENLNTALGSLSQKNLLQRPGNYTTVDAATNQNYSRSTSLFKSFESVITDVGKVIASPFKGTGTPELIGAQERISGEWSSETWSDTSEDFENSYIDVFDEGIDADDETGFADFDF